MTIHLRMVQMVFGTLMDNGLMAHHGTSVTSVIYNHTMMVSIMVTHSSVLMVKMLTEMTLIH